MENDLKEMSSAANTTACISCGQIRCDFDFKKNNFNLYRCQNCGHTFIFPFPTDIETIYRDDYFSGAKDGFGYVDYDQDKEPMRKAFEKSLEHIEKFIPQPKNSVLLDVGAATGFFMDIAKRRGWQVRGVEISDFATQIGRNKGLDIQSLPLEEVSFGKETFDLITMWDVLEHFRDPSVSIQKSRDFLKPGGIIAINTPDIGSFYARLLSSKWHLLVPPEHIHYFNQKSISIFLERYGFEVLEITTVGKSFTLEYISSTVARWQNSKILASVSDFLKRHSILGKISLPINLRDNMFIIARKK